jgi:UDP-N-acetylmuramoylalanine--D-glutamate ligase
MNKSLIILGGGESGVGAAVLGKLNGYTVFLSDKGFIKPNYKSLLEKYGIDYEEGQHSSEKILKADEVMKSPGIPHKNEMVQQILQMGIPLVSEMELAYRHKGNSKIIGITGSNGKTTTTSLIYHILKQSGADCALVGNIGNSIALQIALDPKSIYVAEISSFQLDDIDNFRPDIAVLTNITEDHLDRYGYNFENYIKAKFNIIKNQKELDFFIYCEDDTVTMEYLNNYPTQAKKYSFSLKHEVTQGAYIKNEIMTMKTNETDTMSIYDFALKGMHNQYNTLAAGITTSLAGIRKEKIREAISSFEGLEHRMEIVASIRGVKFINDSKATNVNSTWFALESMKTPVVLILGGVDKGNDYSLLSEMVKEKVKAIVCLGIDNEKIHLAFKDDLSTIIDTTSMEDAVAAAYSLSVKGDVVLLSPACASFDLFKSYEDRGKQFKTSINKL